jgi:iron(III) transport system ATP-binding protein
MSSSVSVQHVAKSFGDEHAVVDASFSVDAGSTMALLGPSGCGKTTLLRVVAGLERPTAGSVLLDGEVITGPNVFLAPEKRRIGMVFQDGALFPHMTVAQNIAYGLPKDADRNAEVAELLELVDLQGLGARRPETLSGGQAQRVALARALAPKPEVLLLDEPFSSLDAELRLKVRSEVAGLLRELAITSIYVTHDQEEAFVLGDDVAVMRGGTVVQVGTPADVYDCPASTWLAGFVGKANLIPGLVTGGIAETQLGDVEIIGDIDGERQVLLRPEHLQLSTGSTATVRSVEFYGHDTVYVVAMGEQDLTIRSLGSPRFAVGETADVTYHGPATPAY